MHAIIFTFCCLAVAFTSGGVLTHIPSGSVGVSADGALVAGPAGSIHTNNGLYGHGAGVQISGSSGDLHTHTGHAIISGYLDNTWGLSAEEDEHADNGDWHEEEHGDGIQAEEHNDWAKEDGEKRWDDEEDKQWDDNEGQWAEDHSEWHERVKRQAPRKISNGPEGRWNKEEERYIWNDNRKNDENRWINDKADAIAPFGFPTWDQFK